MADTAETIPAAIIDDAALGLHKRDCLVTRLDPDSDGMVCPRPVEVCREAVSHRERGDARGALEAAWPAITAHLAAATDAERELRNAAYAERDRLVAALSKCFPSHLARHDGADWEDDWRNIVCVHLPTGQATWHIHDTELPWFAHLDPGPNHWDGHGTDEKYQRIADLLDGAAATGGQ